MRRYSVAKSVTRQTEGQTDGQPVELVILTCDQTVATIVYSPISLNLSKKPKQNKKTKN